MDARTAAPRWAVRAGPDRRGCEESRRFAPRWAVRADHQEQRKCWKKTSFLKSEESEEKLKMSLV